MKIEIVKNVTVELVQAFERLIPQLTSNATLLSMDDLKDIVESDGAVLFVAKDHCIVGTLTLTINKVPTGTKVWIDDVVVDNEMRGKGIGEQLVLAALAFANKKGYKDVNLTTAAKRVAAHRLYERLGFYKRDTSVYRYCLD